MDAARSPGPGIGRPLQATAGECHRRRRHRDSSYAPSLPETSRFFRSFQKTHPPKRLGKHAAKVPRRCPPAIAWRDFASFAAPPPLAEKPDLVSVPQIDLGHRAHRAEPRGHRARSEISVGAQTCPFDWLRAPNLLAVSLSNPPRGCALCVCRSLLAGDGLWRNPRSVWVLSCLKKARTECGLHQRRLACLRVLRGEKHRIVRTSIPLIAGIVFID
jgi:hypothetical protein